MCTTCFLENFTCFSLPRGLSATSGFSSDVSTSQALATLDFLASLSDCLTRLWRDFRVGTSDAGMCSLSTEAIAGLSDDTTSSLAAASSLEDGVDGNRDDGRLGLEDVDVVLPALESDPASQLIEHCFAVIRSIIGGFSYE